MIINHSNKFIFFANRKTASTSTAIALSSSCSNRDVITPLGRDEKIRRELGYQGPINFIPWWNKVNYFAVKAKCKLLKRGATRPLKTIGLHTHIEAKTALDKKYISKEIFESYFSFCFIRNPWDHTLSQFFELTKKQNSTPLDLDVFINGGMLEKFATSCRSIYSDQDKVLVKQLYHYEKLEETIYKIFNDLNLTGNPKFPRAKTNLRTDKRSYRDILNSDQKIKFKAFLRKKLNGENIIFNESKHQFQAHKQSRHRHERQLTKIFLQIQSSA